MKKTVFLLIFILLPAAALSEALNHTVQGKETYYLKLRAGFHPEFLRIVLEGTESIISNGIVSQKGREIMVRFPDSRFTIQEQKVQVAYRIDKDIISFSPGIFLKFKVFSLKYPSRLVIDVYLETGRKEVKPFVEIVKPLPDKDSRMYRIRTVVIDPGHGGYEYGITTKDYKEKNVALDIAKRLRALITRDSTECFLTRKSDRFMSLGERAKFTDNKNAEIFLSLHVGKHNKIVLYTPVITESAPSEVKTFLANKGQDDFLAKTAALRNALQQAITEDFGDDMVSIRPLPYSILSKIGAAALIIELPSFENAYYVAEFKTQIANTIYKGIYLYEENAAH